MTLKNNRARLLYYVKLCASFQIHHWSQNWVTVRKRSIRVKIGDFCPAWHWNFDGWPWKTIGCFFYTTWSFVQHFKAIGIFKLELQSRNAQFGSKLAIFCPVRRWKLTDNIEQTIGNLSYAASTFVHHFIVIGEFELELQSGNAQFGSKSTNFFSCVTLKFDGWPWKTIGHLF